MHLFALAEISVFSHAVNAFWCDSTSTMFKNMHCNTDARVDCFRFRVYFDLVICRCCCMTSQTNVRSCETQELAGLHRSEPCNSGAYLHSCRSFAVGNAYRLSRRVTFSSRDMHDALATQIRYPLIRSFGFIVSNGTFESFQSFQTDRDTESIRNVNSVALLEVLSDYATIGFILGF